MCSRRRVSRGVCWVRESRSLGGGEGLRGSQPASPRSKALCHWRTWVSGVVPENWVCGESDDVELKINVLWALVLIGRYLCVYFQIKAV